LDPELYNTRRKVKADDNVEGALVCTFFYDEYDMDRLQSRLVVSRNANDESEVDDSLLNVGLFTYPILQAADILAYR
jgi:tryptophanyl-tRNA synthetase